MSEGEGDMSYLLDGFQGKHISMQKMKREISIRDDIHAVKEFIKLFRKEKPDIVHTKLAKAGMVARFAAFLTGTPIIIHTFHGHVFSGYFSPLKTRIFIWIERLLAKLSTKIIVVSTKIKEEICSTYRITSPKKVVIIPLGFELEKMESLEKYKGYFREKFSIPNDSLVIGIIGRITDIKNHDLFLDIAQHISQKQEDVHFLIIGDGELRSTLEEKVQTNNLSQKIHFTGWINETAKIYADIDILVQTSKNEGTPVTIIEAMWYSIPVVSTNVGGIPDLILDKKTGFLINSFQPNDFVDVLLELLSDDQLRENIGSESHIFIKQNFSIDRLIKDIRDLYDSLLKEKRIAC